MRGQRLLSALGRETRRWREERAHAGVRYATLSRLREHLGVEDLERRATVMAQQLTDERSFLRSELEGLGTGLAQLAGDRDELVDRLDALEHRHLVWTVAQYLRHVTVDEKMLVSVVMATRNRSGYLPRAIASILEQTYARWELLVVDDGSDDDTALVLAGIDDERVRCLRGEHRGLAAARNSALAEAAGDLVAYLDDDNLMHPEWLRSVVWAFSEWPDVDVLYGAMIIDDELRAQRLGAGGLPWLNFVPYSRDRLEAANVADVGQVAHRARLAEAHFDEELGVFEDWDLLLRLTAERDPLALPAVAGVYTTSAPGRLMGHLGADAEEATRRIRAKLDR